MVVPRRLRWQAALTHLGRLPRAAERGESGRGGGRISVSVYRSWQRPKIALRRFRLRVPDAYFARDMAGFHLGEENAAGDERIGGLDRTASCPDIWWPKHRKALYCSPH
jgi:hypothetical protein